MTVQVKKPNIGGKTMKKLIALVLAMAMVLSMAACAPKAPATNPSTNPSSGGSDPTEPTAPARPDSYVRADDEEMYAAALSQFLEIYNQAKECESISERFAMMAKAEAYLLDAAVMVPNTTQGGAYTISRVAPRTIPYVQWGNDTDRLKGLVISDEFLTPAERDDLLAMWAKACNGEVEYDPAAYLIGKGHTIQNTYTTTFSTAPVTLDWLNTSSQSDTEILVNVVDGLIEYDNLNKMNPALAESWEISDDCLTYTFHIRKGVKWFTSDGQAYAELTAHDFVAGFQHMMDAQAGLEWLVDGLIVGVSEYMYEGGDFADVGYKAADDYTLVVTLTAPTSYFMTMLSYSLFQPICKSFYEAHGGVYGMAELAEATASDTYTFGKNTDVSSQVYCGAFLLTKLNESSEIKIVKNPGYYKADEVVLESVTWIYDAGEDLVGLYNATVAGTYAGISVSNATTGELAKKDGNFEKYAYVSDTTSTTYFGGLNLNRGTFALESGACASIQTEDQKIDTHIAMQNKNFRKAIAFAWDRATQNAISRGEDLKCTNLRNMYTHPEFVSLSEDVTIDGKTFKAGTFYGEMVQYFCDQLGANVTVADGVDGWFNADNAKAAFAAAKAELGDSVSFPINIDVVYYSASDLDTAQAAAFKASVEGVLGAENVVVNLIEATTSADYYACGYRAANGEAGNFDMFYGSGWGPDYGDPSSYLDTFLPDGAGYMTKVIGLF